ncbi:MAG: serine/threonine protein kinase [bacterium]|nr:serine/threonine protein kinase [bacterium]
MTDRAINQTIGSYEIGEQIGSGGMGIVYKVHKSGDNGRTFAMKVMKEEHLKDNIRMELFKNESLLADRIAHPNIVKVHERGEANGNLYIVMELLNGQTLAQRYDTYHYPSVFQCIHMMCQVAHLLVHLHGDGIMHRDIKPENIMLINREGDPDFVKLLDFGIAKELHPADLKNDGKVLGTISYLPPEVVHRASFSAAMDIYSLGIVGYEMLTRLRPFHCENLMDTMREILTRTPPAPIELNTLVPPRLNSLILDMIAKKTINRPDARAVLTTLASLQ